ncbi:MAG: 3-deoxy-D-manno-octulosonic acid transferase [Gammaproteobacteria bacterium]
MAATNPTFPKPARRPHCLVRFGARFAYALLSVFALPFALWRLAKRGWRAGDDEVVRWREYFGFCPPPPADDGRAVVWLHAVSVGEAAAAAELVRDLQKEYRLILTHTTAAGGGFWRRHFDGAGVVVCACPLDIPFAARIFFRRCRPALGIVMEAEYWPNLITSARAAGCKLVLANARLNKTSARKYANIAPLMRECAVRFDAVCAQHRNDARRLRFFGAANVCVAGNMKFDRKLDEKAAQSGRQWREDMPPQKPVLLVAGSRPGEEERILSAMAKTGATDKLHIVWAPRHPQRAAVLATMLNRRGIPFARRSEGDTIGKSRFYIADTIGEMDAFYAFCDIALICGSFAPYGGQNPIEAMQHNIAAVIGPHAENYRQLVRNAVKTGALVQAQNADDAIQTCLTLANDIPRRQQIAAATKTFHNQNRGALAKTRKTITPLLR